MNSYARSLRFAIRATAWTLAAAWTLKAISLARNLRRVQNLATASFDRSPSSPARTTVVVPACNEADSIRQCVDSLLAQNFPVQIIAVDDRSTDATGYLLDELAADHPGRLTVLHITYLPSGWLGKTHAMHRAAEYAFQHQQPDFLLFTDGDVFFHPEALRRAVACAQATHADHLVLMPSLILHSVGEAILLAYLHALSFWAVRPWRVPDPKAHDTLGVGAFNLLRASAYKQVGGYEALRFQIVEDLALGRRIKQLGLRQQVVFGPSYIRLHWAAGVSGIIRTMTKNLFAIYGYRLPLVIASCAGLVVFCLGPFLGLASRRSRLPSALAITSIAGVYAIAARTTKMPTWTAAGFPAATILFLVAIIRSTVATLRQGGVEWRGTIYPLADLRAQTEPLSWRSLNP